MFILQYGIPPMPWMGGGGMMGMPVGPVPMPLHMGMPYPGMMPFSNGYPPYPVYGAPPGMMPLLPYQYHTAVQSPLGE